MKRLRLPKLKAGPPPSGRHQFKVGTHRDDDERVKADLRPAAGRHRAGGRKLTSKPGRRRAPEAIPPWSDRDDYAGRHRKSDPPPSAAGRPRRKQTEPGRRLTPDDSRTPGYFRR